MENQSAEYICCCLADCDFSETQKQQYMKYHETGQQKECLRLLYLQRKQLMDSLHGVQQQVDVIDYFIQKLERMIQK